MILLARVISWVFSAYEILILIRVLLSWINVDPYRPAIRHPLVRLLQQVTDPVLAPLRRLIPPIAGTVDISPVIALFALEILRRVITSALLSL
jgi:YggT family protein